MMRLLEQEASWLETSGLPDRCGNPARALTNHVLEQEKSLVAVRLPVIFRQGGDERIGFLDGCV
jgi:hypothetical protein